MEFRHLKYFLALAEELNFSRAAERLFISQPPLTRQIKQLEEQLGVDLFIRTPRGVKLTEAGERFKKEAVKIQSLTEKAIKNTQMTQRGEMGHLQLGIFGSAIFSIIPTLVRQFHELYPMVEISLHNMSKVEQLEAIREGRLTLGFNRLFPHAPDMEIDTVLTENVVVAVHMMHPLSNRKQIAIRELSNEQLILFPNKARPSLADDMIALCREAGFTPNIVQEAEDVVSSVALVSVGLGISFVPESTVNLKLPNVRYIKLVSPTPKLELNCVYRKNDRSPLLSAFLDIISDFKNN